MQHNPSSKLPAKDPESTRPIARQRSECPVVALPPLGESLDLWTRENLGKHSVFRTPGRDSTYFVSGEEGRRLVNERSTDRKGLLPLIYPGDNDYRRTTEISRVLERFSCAEAVAALQPTLEAHVQSWCRAQVLDLQAACLELAWALSWEVELGEPPPIPSSDFAAVTKALLLEPELAVSRYEELLGKIEASASRKDPAEIPNTCLLAHYLHEEAAGRMSRRETVQAVAHGLVTGFAVGTIYTGIVAELGRAQDTSQDQEASWRRLYFDDEDALDALVTEACHLYARVLTQQGRLATDGPHRVVNGVVIPAGSVVVLSIHGENRDHGNAFEPDRWADDPTDSAQRSAAFGGCHGNDAAIDPATGEPAMVRCPAVPLTRGLVAAFARHVLGHLKWVFQSLAEAPTTTDDGGVGYHNGLMARVAPMAQPLLRPPLKVPRTIQSGAEVVVVGGGIGGLVAARELQARGCRVRVIEAASRIGAGKCETVEIEGRDYDVGAHLVSMTGPIAQLAAEVGVAMKPSPGGRGYETFTRTDGKNTRQPIRTLEVFAQLDATLRNLETLGLEPGRDGLDGLENLAATRTKLVDPPSPALEFADSFFYGAGYGYEELSAAYILRFARTALERGETGGTPACGFGPFLEALAVDLDVSCGSPVTTVDRTGERVEVNLASGETLTCDELFVACQRPWSFLGDSLDPPETQLLQQIRYFPYMTAILHAPGLSRRGLCVAATEAKGGPVSAWIYFHDDTDVLTVWGYAAEGQSDEAWFATLVDELATMGAILPESPAPLYLRRWDYFPHVSPGDFAAGFYTKLAHRQGKHHTWFGGGLTSFELTDVITAWTKDFVDHVCRVPEGDPNRLEDKGVPGQIRVPSHKNDPAANAAWLIDLEREFPTIVHGLRHHARTVPTREMFVCAENERKVWTFASMWEQAAGIGVQLRKHGIQEGDRVLVMYTPDSAHFPAAFWGCLVNGVVAVPLPPPRPFVGDVEGLETLRLIAEDSGAVAILTDSRYRNFARIDAPLQVMRRVVPLGSRGNQPAWPKGLKWICTDKAPATGPLPETLPDPDQLAYVQYTSGSTRAPRGVKISHRMVVQNCLSAARDTVQLPGSRTVSWLPWWHDLMVVTGACEPAIIGCTMVFFSAMKWLADPTCWFEVVQAEGATGTAAPNFGLDVMASKADMKRLSGVDLSEVVIYSGGEVCRHATFAHFLERFGPLGFQAHNLRNIMGMAEATLYLSGGAVGDTRYVAFDREALRVELSARRLPPHHPGAQILLSVGRALSPANDISMIIVDPETRAVLPCGAVGELWVTGPSVAAGHITPTATDHEQFQVSTSPESETRFLRTGDLGFIDDGMVFVCGRLKELIIVGGRNIVPTDLESAAGTAHPAIRPGCVAAFGVADDDASTESIAVIAEVRSAGKPGKPDPTQLAEIVAAIRAAIGRAADAECRYVGLAPAHSLPKTTSGKLKRTRIRRDFERGELDLLSEVSRIAPPKRATETTATTQRRRNDGPVTPDRAREWIVDTIGEQLRLSPEDITLHIPFAELGIDSLAAVRVFTRLQDVSGITLSPADAFNTGTVDSLAVLMSARTLSQALVERPYVVLNPKSASSEGLAPGRTVFCLPPAGGSVFPYVRLAAQLPELVFVVFENQSARDGRSFSDTVALFVQSIRELMPAGPWVLAGYSFGGIFGAAVAHELRDCTLVLIDAPAPVPEGGTTSARELEIETAATTGLHLVAQAGIMVLDGEGAEAGLRNQIVWDLSAATRYRAPALASPRRREDLAWTGIHAVQLRAEDYEPDVRDALMRSVPYDDSALGWDRLCAELVTRRIPGGHFSVLGTANVGTTADALREELARSPYFSTPMDQE